MKIGLGEGGCGYTDVIAQSKKPAPQTAHLVFSDTQANAEKPKEPFFANAPTNNRIEKSNLDDIKY